MIQILNEKNFKELVLDSKDIVLVDFFATWCGPCQMLLPILESTVPSLGKNQKIYKVDVDASPELASQYGVMSIPAIKVFKDGKVVEDSVGIKQKNELLEMLNRHKEK